MVEDLYFSFFGDHLKIFFEDVFFSENTCRLCPWLWPQEGLFSEGLSLASDFFVLGLGLEPCVLDSISVGYVKDFWPIARAFT